MQVCFRRERLRTLVRKHMQSRFSQRAPARKKYNRSVDTASLRRKLDSEAKPNALPQAERTKSHAGLPLERRFPHASDRFVTQPEPHLCTLLSVFETRHSLGARNIKGGLKALLKCHSTSKHLHVYFHTRITQPQKLCNFTGGIL